MLVWIDKDGKVITTSGRGCVGQDPEGKVLSYLYCKLDSFIVTCNYLYRSFLGTLNP